MHTAQELVRLQPQLVSLPSVYMKVKEIVEDDNGTARDLARIIALDPAMTARLLRLVNSAFWGFRGRIESVSRAVSLLGMFHVHDLVLATSVADAFRGVRPKIMDVARFWRGSVMRALAATALARTAGLADLGRVFTEGLLSDLGHMVLYLTVPEPAAEARSRTGTEIWRLAELERASIGCDYAEVGGALTDAWSLPACFGEAIRHQTAPAATAEHGLEAAFLHIAGIGVDARIAGLDLAGQLVAMSPHAWQTTGLSPDCLADVVEEASNNASATLNAFHFTAAA